MTPKSKKHWSLCGQAGERGVTALWNTFALMSRREGTSLWNTLLFIYIFDYPGRTEQKCSLHFWKTAKKLVVTWTLCSHLLFSSFFLLLFFFFFFPLFLFPLLAFFLFSFSFFLKNNRTALAKNRGRNGCYYDPTVLLPVFCPLPRLGNRKRIFKMLSSGNLPKLT